MDENEMGKTETETERQRQKVLTSNPNKTNYQN
jgi:hypothetical protein